MSAIKGTFDISKYYYSIDNGEYQESTNNTYTFTGLEGSTTHTVKVKVVDTKGKYSSEHTSSITTSPYNLPTITNVTSTKAWNQIKVTVSASQGTSAISKYMYSINNGTFQESTSNTYTFSNLTASTTYTIKTKVVDTLGRESAVRIDTISTAAYVLPTITNLSSSVTASSITVTATVTKGTGNISKYYYSKDGGSSYTETTTNSHTFTGLTASTTYAIKVYVKDSNGKTSAVSSKSIKTSNPTLATYVKSKYTSQGSNGIYLHNSSLANSANDGSYRYAGANPNNYVCFGSTESTCPTDNLYRIIGVFEDQVKLIKYDYATSTALGTSGAYYSIISASNYSTYKGSLSTLFWYYWNYSTHNNSWSEANLNTTNLNNGYLSHLGTTWTSKIVATIWKVGGNTYANILESPMYTAYQNEIVSPSANTTYNAKIGLMYVSDYGYAASPTYWTYAGYNSRDSSKDYRAAINDNWMYMGAAEWTISKISGDSSIVFSLEPSGRMNNGIVSVAHLSVRPVFYLNSNVTYTGVGDGSSGSPYRIN